MAIMTIRQHDRVRITTGAPYGVSDGTLGIAWLIHDADDGSHEAVSVLLDNEDALLRVATADLALHLHRGEPVLVDRDGPPHLAVLQGYTRNRCYRVTEIESYTGCDYRAEHLQPLPDHGYAYLARHSHDGPFIVYTPGSPCSLCAPATDAAPGCAAPRQHARDQVAEWGRGWIEATEMLDHETATTSLADLIAVTGLPLSTPLTTALPTLSRFVLKPLADHGISTLEGLTSYTPETLRDIPQLGARRRAALLHALTALADSHAT